MARITPRSINIRECERAILATDRVHEHVFFILTAYSEGAQAYQDMNLPLPEAYVTHGQKLSMIEDGLVVIKDMLNEILKEL